MNPEELDRQLEQLYSSAQSASSEGLREEALKHCQEALALLEQVGEDTERHSLSDFVMLMGDIYWTAGDYEDAYRAYHKVMLNDPERNDARVAVGVSLFHLCRFHSAQTILEQCSIEDSDDPEIWYYLGLLALRHEQRELAMNYFETAHELQENRFFIPVEISDEEIVAIVEKQIDEIPKELADALHNLPIILEKRPSDEMLFTADPPLDPLVLGIFSGVPLTEMTHDTILSEPSRIILFTENIWLIAGNRETLEEELWVTLKHEIGHFFGLSEEDLAERGLD